MSYLDVLGELTWGNDVNIRPWVMVAACVWVVDSHSARADQSSDAESQALQLLASPNVDEVSLGIESLGLLPSPRTAAALIERTRRGLPRELMELAIGTLSAMDTPAATPIFIDLSRDRRPSVRAKALEALAGIPRADAIVAIRHGVDDADATVRAAAIDAVGTLNDRESVPLLLRALSRGVQEAAPVIGHLGNADQVRQLLEYLGRASLEFELAGCAEALNRTDLPQRLRLDIVALLTELATEQIRTFFTEVLTTLPGGANDPVRRAVNDAIMRISG